MTALVLVVGPSGAGKDSLIGAARRELAADPRFVFPRRTVTRDAVADLEDHDTVDRPGFARLLAEGAFALDWQAHGLCYGLPASIDRAMDEGKVVVCNGSRRMLPVAQARYPKALRVVLVTADIALRAQRLAGRGRETAAEIAQRLARDEAPLPEGIAPLVIDNSAALAIGVAAFTKALDAIAAD